MHNKINASVALICYSSLEEASLKEKEIIFIKRAIHPLDPWSGHCALPGGGHEKIDGNYLNTALRETHEEIGLKKNQLDFKMFITTLVPKKKFKEKELNLRAYLFSTTSMPRFFDAEEVAGVFSVGISNFLKNDFYSINSNKNFGDYLCITDPKTGHVIWGLTLAIVLYFLQRYFPNEISQIGLLDAYFERKNKYLSFFEEEIITI